MTTFKAVLISLVALFALTRASDAEARRLRVWYDTANEPVGFNRSVMLSEIQEAMREWEYHGAGKIVLEWRGVTTRRAGGGGDDLIFGWDPGLNGTNACAETWTYAAFQAAPMGRVNFNPGMWGRRSITRLPVTGENCNVMRSVLIHETAHWFRWDHGHPPESVLASTCASPGVCSDHIAMHLWNSDMAGINQNPYFPLFAPTYPPQDTLVLTDIYHEGSGGVTHGGGFNVGPENFTASLGLGGPAFDYALAFTTVVTGNGHRIVVEQGNGRVPWGNRRLIEGDTAHQTCITGVPGTADMYVAWAAPRQRSIASTPPGTPAFANAGERAVRFAESHDGGDTWSAPADVAGAFTRTGVSCGFDAARGRVVLVWADSVGFTVRYTERNPAAGGAAAWLAPRAMGSGTIPFVMTYETPLVSFDPFTPGSGLLTWSGSTHRAPLLARIAHDGASYGIGWFTYTTSLAEQTALRTNVVPNPFGTDIHFALGLNTPVPAQVRLRRREFVTLATETATSSSAAYDRYLGSGTNRGFFETAYVRQMIPIP